jgi:hypothetical protein
MLFVPTSRAALNATPLASHGRTSGALSVGRLLGAAVGAELAGLALTGGPTASDVHTAMLVAAIVCFAVGLPVSLLFATGATAAGTGANPLIAPASD